MRRLLLVAVIACGSTAAYAQTYAYDLQCVGVNWTAKQVRFDAWFIGRLAGGVWGCDWIKIFGPGYWDGGTATGTLLGAQTFPLNTVSGGVSVLGTFTNSGSYNICMAAQGTGTYGVVGKNATFTVDWASKVFTFQGQAYLPPTIDNNGVVVPGTGGQPQGGTQAPGPVDWTDAQKQWYAQQQAAQRQAEEAYRQEEETDRRSWFESLYKPDEAHINAVKTAAARLKTAGPMGDAEELKTRLAAGSTAGPQTLTHTFWFEFDKVGGGQADIVADTGFFDPALPVDLGMGAGGADGNSPWLNKATVGDFQGMFRTVLLWASWAFFGVGVLLWVKGRFVT